MIVRLIPGFDGFYKIREDGKKVWSCKSKGRGNHSIHGPWRRKAIYIIKKYGHHTVSLRRNGRTETHLVHRLVLLTFKGPCPPGKECRHYPDQNPANNHYTNLILGTRKENMEDKEENGTTPRGESNGLSKLTEEQVIQIRKKKSTGNYTNKVLGKMYGVNRHTISKIINRKLWWHI